MSSGRNSRNNFSFHSFIYAVKLVEKINYRKKEGVTVCLHELYKVKASTWDIVLLFHQYETMIQICIMRDNAHKSCYKLRNHLKYTCVSVTVSANL